MKDHLLAQGTRATPQTEPIPGRVDQVENSAGGYVWDVDMWGRLRRFLILGSEGGSYYASERKLTTDNVGALHECIVVDGPRTVGEIVAISDSGRAPQNDAALYALAACISLGDKETKSAAAEALPLVARIGTHLYHFVAYAETMRGWGRTLRWAVQNWYDQNPERLAFQAIKYRQRDGWSHRDLLRLAHPDSHSREQTAIFDWITHGTFPDYGVVPRKGRPDRMSQINVIEAFEKAQRSTSPAETAALVREYNLPREALLTEHLDDPGVWKAMLDKGMPIHAMTRNLANMTRYGILNDRNYLRVVCKALTDPVNVRKSRLHPISLLTALKTYASGQGFRGTTRWSPLPEIMDSLDEAFYLAFDNVEATGKNILLGVDVSGSMTSGHVAGVAGLSPREAAVAMALVTLHAEPGCRTLGFTDRLYEVSYSRRQRLDDAVARTPRTGEGTDCAIPVIAALNDLTTGKAGDFKWDAIVLYTDNETWAGSRHVTQAIREYRDRSGVPTRLIACGLVANAFTVCDPTDPLSLNVVGFDTATPAMIQEFAAGRL